jgi:5-amino-6-(5-phosphoribosylamino)uracil reductase
VTAAGQLDPPARFFTGPGTPLVYAAAAAAAATAENLADRAVVIDAGAEPSLPAVLHDLHSERGVGTLLAEGGSRVLRDLLALNLADELRVAIAPFLIGDDRAPRFAPCARYPQTPANPMTLLSLRQVGNVAVHHYRLSSRAPIEEVPIAPETTLPRMQKTSGSIIE